MATIHPSVMRIVRHFKAHPGYRVTSIIRPGSAVHEAGKAVDVAPLVYDDDGATVSSARALAKMMRRAGLPPSMVIGEGDHFHIEPAASFSYGAAPPQPLVWPRRLETEDELDA